MGVTLNVLGGGYKMLIDRNKIKKNNSEKAIIRCIELKGLKNPDNIKHICDNTYSHTNIRRRTRYFRIVYGWSKYNAQAWSKIKHKLHKVNGYYIGEFDTI